MKLNPFNLPKAIEVIGHLLGHNDGCMDYNRILSLLYIVERQLWVNHHFLVVEDAIVCLNGIPVLATLLDYCRREKRDKSWDEMFIYKDTFTMAIASSPEQKHCSGIECNFIQQVNHNYTCCSDDKIVDILRDLPEACGKDHGIRVEIDHVDILQVNGFSKRQIDYFVEKHERGVSGNKVSVEKQ